MDKRLLLRALFLTEPSLIEAVGGLVCDPGRGIDDVRRKLRLAFYKALPHVPEHQRRSVLDEFFDHHPGYDDLVINAFTTLACAFFTWRAGDIRWRMNGVLPWAEWFSTCLSTLPLMACKADLASHGGPLRADIIDRVFSGPIVPLTEDPILKRLFGKKLIETHMHFSNTAHPALVWDQALKHSSAWVRDTRSGPSHLNIWEHCIPDFSPEEMFVLLGRAKAVRAWLVAWDRDEDLGGVPGYTEWITRAGLWPFDDPTIPVNDHPAEILTGARPENPLVCEGAFWAHTLHRLHQKGGDVPAKLLHIYHLIQAQVQKATVHQERLKGFDLFEELAQSPLRDHVEKKLVKERLIQIDRTGCLAGLEARIAGKETTQEFLSKKLGPLVRSYKALRDEKAPKDLFELGVICHFIKKEDKERNQHESGCMGGVFLSGRHAALRESLLKQADAVLQAREFYPQEGKFLIAIDGAGNELSAPPEVFAPVFRWVSSRVARSSTLFFPTIAKLWETDDPPPLRFTFHAGEEFHHLLSGVRAIDEAVEFLDLEPGSRLGHCLALGLEPANWLKENMDVRLPRLEWLDNLVYLHRFTFELPEFRPRLEQTVLRLCREVYGRQWPIDLLAQAWHWRALGPNESEKALHTQQRLYRSLHDRFPDAEPIYDDYHFRERVWEKGQEHIVAQLDEPDNAGLAAAMDKAQQNLEKNLGQRRLAIESCPISNLRIGSVRRLSEHPVFRWHDPKGTAPPPRLHVLLCTDNPGLFQSSLPLEYAAMAKAAEERDGDLSGRNIMDWAERIMQDTRLFTFLDNQRG